MKYIVLRLLLPLRFCVTSFFFVFEYALSTVKPYTTKWALLLKSNPLPMLYKITKSCTDARVFIVCQDSNMEQVCLSLYLIKLIKVILLYSPFYEKQSLVSLDLTSANLKKWFSRRIFSLGVLPCFTLWSMASTVMKWIKFWPLSQVIWAGNKDQHNTVTIIMLHHFLLFLYNHVIVSGKKSVSFTLLIK